MGAYVLRIKFVSRIDTFIYDFTQGITYKKNKKNAGEKTN